MLRRIEIARDAAAHIARRILMESTTRRETESDPASDLPSEYDLNPRWEKREQILTTERHGLPFSSIGRVGYSPTLDLPMTGPRETCHPPPTSPSLRRFPGRAQRHPDLFPPFRRSTRSAPATPPVGRPA